MPTDIGPAGPVEWVFDATGNLVGFVGDVIKTGADIVWDTTKFILDQLEAIGPIQVPQGIRATPKQTTAKAAETRAKTYVQLVASGEMSQEEAIARGMAYGMESQKGLVIDQPIIYETPPAKQLSDYMPLAIAGIAAILLMKKGKI